MAHVAGEDTVAKLQSRDADQEIGQGETDAFGGVLPVELAGAESDGHSYWMHRQGHEEFIEELPPHGFPSGRVRANSAMHQLDYSHDGESHVFTGDSESNVCKRLPSVATLALRRDQYA